MDPITTRPEDLSHAVLIGILMHNGGSMDIPREAFTAENLGTEKGFHGLSMLPQEDGTLRISVHPRPEGDEGGVKTI
ncbi:pRL2-19 [Streptomyces sp. NPDC088915]|uniref:pRL2-19 n=1 Tax=Streptomyces sp. NPDC088915 TaxID=3365912 RepID=UPI0038095F02